MSATERKDRPILMSAPMVRALLEGRKTQTRRILDFSRARSCGERVNCDGTGYDTVTADGIERVAWTPERLSHLDCPYGVPGDRLWVREAWRSHQYLDEESGKEMGENALAAGWKSPWGPVAYEEGGNRVNFDTFGGNDAPLGRYRHARFMPRWASRITLTVTEVRVQRLQEISEEDAKAEGAVPEFEMDLAEFAAGRKMSSSTYRLGYKHVWDRINSPGSWDANPWVWAVSFSAVAR